MTREDIENTRWLLTAILAAGQGEGDLLKAHIEQARSAGALEVVAMGLAEYAAAAVELAHGERWVGVIRQDLTRLEIEGIGAEIGDDGHP